jgi:uncharacterized protein (TIGR02231 family)
LALLKTTKMYFMKLFFIFLNLLFFSFSALAGDEKTIESSPAEVTVFLSGAELRYQTELKFNEGQNTFRFIGLPSSINLNSISFNLGESIKILSISGEINYEGKLKASKERLLLEDSVNYFEEEQTKLANELAVWKAEGDLLEANKGRIGGSNGASLLDLQNFATYYRNRTKEIAEKSREINKKIADIQKKNSKLIKALDKIKAQDATPAFELTLIAIAKEAKNIQAKWSYVITEAGWSPLYDLRAKGVDKPIQFTYKGNIFNNSGVNWQKVKLTLSTADVMQNTTPPDLTAWKLDFVNNNDYQQMSNNYNYNIQQQALSMNELDESRAGSVDRAGNMSVAYADIAVSELSTEFDIKELYSIPSDNKAYAVEINEYQLKADYNYVCTPKLDKDAFLIAKILGWETLNLIEGAANIYYNDSYIGKTTINLRKADDTLQVSLGRDKKVIVNRIKKQDFSSRKFLSSTVRELYTYEISVRNTNNTPIYLELIDQLPVSSNSEIEVEVLEISSAARNAETGLLTWKVNLAQGEAKTYTLSYAFKHPRSKKVNVNRTKMQRQYYKK